MSVVHAARSQLRAYMLNATSRRRTDICIKGGAFSVTFDDVPRSALENGVELLASYGVRATFYLSASLSAQRGFISPEDARELVEKGHEIGCHTYSHYRLSKGSVGELTLDAARNRAALAVDFGLGDVGNFSYPFGEVSDALRRSLESDYTTLRSVYAGVNGRQADLTLLRANAVYTASVDWRRIERQAARASKMNAWVIFYTHGVEQEPDRFGCRPDDLKRVCEIALAHRLTPIRVRDVLHHASNSTGLGSSHER